MKRDQFLLVAREVASRADGDLTRIGHLIMRNAGHALKEPQLRHLWALECDRLGQYYTFEGPTKRKYRFNGKKAFTVGRHDLILYEIELQEQENGKVKEQLSSAVVELKHGLSSKALNSDLAKFFGESDSPNLKGMALMIVDEKATQLKLKKFFDGLPGHIQDQLRLVDRYVQGGHQESRNDPWLEILIVVRHGQARGLYRARLDDGRELTIKNLRNNPLSLTFMDATGVAGRDAPYRMMRGKPTDG